MWLLRVSSVLEDAAALELVSFIDPPPEYAIVSHTWAADEVVFEDVARNTARGRHGFRKLRLAARQAEQDGLVYLWMDTCCINKSSSTELQEAINSMFQWYMQSTRCYVYLEDVTGDLTEPSMETQLRAARWFTRGWTLQELLASRTVCFYSRDWQCLHPATTSGLSGNLLQMTTLITGIDAEYLRPVDRRPLSSASIAIRMHWASSRQTTRPEDVAYSLMGIFGIQMPLLYGEGKKIAFSRLQDEIMRRSDDHSLFGWALPTSQSEYEGCGLLADEPSWFKTATTAFSPCHPRKWAHQDLYSLTKNGVSIRLPLRMIESGLYIAALDCQHPDSGRSPALYLRRLDDGGTFTRVRCDTIGSVASQSETPTPIFVRNGTASPSNSQTTPETVSVPPPDEEPAEYSTVAPPSKADSEHNDGSELAPAPDAEASRPVGERKPSAAFRDRSPAFRICPSPWTDACYDVVMLPSRTNSGYLDKRHEPWAALELNKDHFWFHFFDSHQTAMFVLEHKVTEARVVIIIAPMADGFGYRVKPTYNWNRDVAKFERLSQADIQSTFLPMGKKTYLIKHSEKNATMYSEWYSCCLEVKADWYKGISIYKIQIDLRYRENVPVGDFTDPEELPPRPPPVSVWTRMRLFFLTRFLNCRIFSRAGEKPPFRDNTALLEPGPRSEVDRSVPVDFSTIASDQPDEPLRIQSALEL